MVYAKRCALMLCSLLMVWPMVTRGGGLRTHDPKIDRLLKAMTLEEKIGQMTQVTIDVVSRGADGRAEPHAIDPAKLDTAILRYHVGSILNVGPSGYTLDHWHEVIRQIQDVALTKTRLKIPVLYGIDAVHGANYTLGATIFPQAIGVAATWDPAIAEESGGITAMEIRASGIPWNFYPVLDIGRQPLWPRFWETYGEGVMFASTLGAAYVKGLQGSDMGSPTRAAACLKHYAGYSYPLNGKDRTPAWIDERMMREYFLPPFEAAVKAGAPTVMVNSSEINGIPGHANYHLITEVLKKEWKFDGFVVSDWEDIKRLHTRDRVADSPKEAVRMAVMAGIDMSMVPMDFSFYTLLLELVKEKKVPMSRIDDAVRRILAVKLATGLFERPYPDPALKKEFATPASRQANLRAAEESITLLKNEAGVLPLKKGGRVLVTGPAANMLSPLNSGWTITWQGDNEALYPKDRPTILRAIEEAVGKDHVTYVPGTTFSEPVDITAAVSAARGVDAVVLCLGEKAYCETPGNIDDLTLDAAQLTLAEELGKTGTPVILVLTEGRPRVINRIVGAMKGIALAYLPGMEGGTAIARVLFGDANPCGKLPFSYPRFPNSIVPYDHKPIEIADVNRYDPQWAFGFGLSYTTFAYSDLAISRDRVPRGGTVDVSVTVKNTGTRGGKEVAQLYVTDRYGSVSRPVAQLKGFTKIYLEPGQSTTVRWTLGPKDLSFVGLKNTRVVEPGEFVVKVGDMSRSFTLEP